MISSVLKLGDAFLKLANTDIGVLVTKIGLLAGAGWGLSSLIQVSKIIPVIVGQFKNFGAVLSLVAEGSGTFGAALSAAGGAGAVALPIFLAVSAAIVGIVEAVKAYKESHPDFDTAAQSVATISDSLKTAQDRLDEINKLGWKDRTRAINEEEQELKDLIAQQERELQVAQMRQAMAAGEELSERTGYGQATRYTAISPNDTDNQTFAKLLDFYISFFSNNHDYELGYQEVLNIRDTKVSPRTIIFSVIGVVIATICVFLGFKSTKPKQKQKVKSNLSKEDKIKYIDMLTSLKNRNYLNDNIEKWDSTGVYPQTVVIIDLNNIAYINDNYGHAEGDKIIGEAANILINTQLPNTEIIRTNGNEFLVYMVGYEEKQVISYTKKLTKEFKLLTHGFGAAIGYSMITDAIKTVDDAINEATTDMKEQKEELDY